MSIVKINALTMVDGKGAEFIERFSRRSGAIEGMDGFEGFQVLRPTDERNTWLVVTQWRDDACYDAWYSGRPHRDPSANTYASGTQVWSYEVIENVPAPA